MAHGDGRQRFVWQVTLGLRGRGNEGVLTRAWRVLGHDAEEAASRCRRWHARGNEKVVSVRRLRAISQNRRPQHAPRK